MLTTAILTSSISVVDTAKAMKVRNDSKVKAMPEMFARHSTTPNSYAFGKQTEHTTKNVFKAKAHQITKLVKCKSTANVSIDLHNLDAKRLLDQILYFRGYHANDVLYNETLSENARKGERYKVTTIDKKTGKPKVTIKVHNGNNVVAVNVRLTCPHWKVNGVQQWVSINTITIKEVYQYRATRVSDKYGYEIYDIFVDSKDLQSIAHKILNTELSLTMA